MHLVLPSSLNLPNTLKYAKIHRNGALLTDGCHLETQTDTEYTGVNTRLASKQDKETPKTPDYLLVDSVNTHTKKRFYLSNVMRKKWHLTCNKSGVITGKIRSILQPIDRLCWMVCLHRASELASPLTRAATTPKKPDNSLTEIVCILTASHIELSVFIHSKYKW